MRHELVGNYLGNRNEVESLFRGRLLTYDYEDESRSVYEVEYY